MDVGILKKNFIEHLAKINIEALNLRQLHDYAALSKVAERLDAGLEKAMAQSLGMVCVCEKIPLKEG